MNSASTTIDSKPVPRRWRMGVQSLFKLQLLLSPLLLIPVYAGSQGQHPYVQLLAYLIAPVCYVALLQVFWSWPTGGKRPTLFVSLWQGGRRGILFALLSVVPLFLMASFSKLSLFFSLLGNLRYATIRARVWENPHAAIGELFRPLEGVLLVTPFLIFQYAVLGAAAAGVIAIARQLLLERQPGFTKQSFEACGPKQSLGPS